MDVVAVAIILVLVLAVAVAVAVAVLVAIVAIPGLLTCQLLQLPSTASSSQCCDCYTLTFPLPTLLSSYLSSLLFSLPFPFATLIYSLLPSLFCLLSLLYPHRLVCFHLFGFSVLAVTFAAIIATTIFYKGERTRLNGCTWPSALTVLRIEEDERLLRSALRWIRVMKRAKRVKRRFLLHAVEGDREEEREGEREGEGVTRVDAVQRCMQSLQRQW